MKETLLGVLWLYLLIFVGAAYVEHEFGISRLLEWLCDNCWNAVVTSMSDFTYEVGQWLS